VIVVVDSVYREERSPVFVYSRRARANASNKLFEGAGNFYSATSVVLETGVLWIRATVNSSVIDLIFPRVAEAMSLCALNATTAFNEAIFQVASDNCVFVATITETPPKGVSPLVQPREAENEQLSKPLPD